MLERDLLPHVGDSFKAKALFLGYMVNKLGKCFHNKIPFDDRDSYCNKRVESSGYLMAVLFRQYFTKLVKDMRNSIMKELNSGPWKSSNQIEDVINSTNLYKILKSTTIESGLKYGLATGNWGIKTNNSKVGIAQVLSRLTYISTLSHLRRVNTPTEKTGKLIAPRKLHPSQWGIICPSETPEGGSVGLVKNLSLSTYITIDTTTEPIVKIIEENGLVKNSDVVQLEDFFNESKILINGEWIGIHKDPINLVNVLVSLKRQAIINPYTSISFNTDMNEVNVFTDAGRCSRPLYIVENRALKITKHHINLLKSKMIKFKNLILGSIQVKIIQMIVQSLRV